MPWDLFCAQTEARGLGWTCFCTSFKKMYIPARFLAIRGPRDSVVLLLLGVAAAICVWLLQNCVAQSVCLQLQRLEEVVHSNKFAFHFGSRKTASSLFFTFQLQIFFVTAETKSCFFVCVAAKLILLLQTCLSLIFLQWQTQRCHC